jgi:hypothetical protein
MTKDKKFAAIPRSKSTDPDFEEYLVTIEPYWLQYLNKVISYDEYLTHQKIAGQKLDAKRR